MIVWYKLVQDANITRLKHKIKYHILFYQQIIRSIKIANIASICYQEYQYMEIVV